MDLSDLVFVQRYRGIYWHQEGSQRKQSRGAENIDWNGIAYLINCLGDDMEMG